MTTSRWNHYPPLNNNPGTSINRQLEAADLLPDHNLELNKRMACRQTPYWIELPWSPVQNNANKLVHNKKIFTFTIYNWKSKVLKPNTDSFCPEKFKKYRQKYINRSFLLWAPFHARIFLSHDVMAKSFASWRHAAASLSSHLIFVFFLGWINAFNKSDMFEADWPAYG